MRKSVFMFGAATLAVLCISGAMKGRVRGGRTCG